MDPQDDHQNDGTQAPQPATDEQNVPSQPAPKGQVVETPVTPVEHEHSEDMTHDESSQTSGMPAEEPVVDTGGDQLPASENEEEDKGMGGV